MPTLTLLGSTYLWAARVCDKPYARSPCYLQWEHSRYRPTHLGVLEDVHDEDGEAQAEDVGCEAGVEVGVGVLL